MADEEQTEYEREQALGIVYTGCANCGRPVAYQEDEDDGPLLCERCGI